MMPIGRKIDFDNDWEASWYWKIRALAAEAFIAVLPDSRYYGDRACLKDAPDITDEQWQAYQAWQELVKEAE